MGSYRLGKDNLKGKINSFDHLDDLSASLSFNNTFSKRGLIFFNLLVLALICLILPLLGARLAGYPVDEYLRFPPLPSRIGYPAFHRGAFIGIITLILLICFFWLTGYQRERGIEEHHSMRKQYPFPLWGWFGLGFGIVIWVVAWTRFKWFAPYQPYTFIPQWLSFIVVVNALTHLRSGTCPILSNPPFFRRLFIGSAILWWVFEYLNRFVNNWIYKDASYLGDPVEYILFATIAFSTVIPGVYSTKKLLDTFSGLQRFFARGPAIRFPTSRAFYTGLVLAVSGSFLFISWYPKILYPIIWIGPFLGWITLNRLIGIPLDLGGITKGNWCYFLGWGFAALICGFFWEMWNYYSMSKWVYQIPYLHGFKVFEMPIAGYTGYLAFGLECAMAVEILKGVSGSPRLKDA